MKYAVLLCSVLAFLAHPLRSAADLPDCALNTIPNIIATPNGTTPTTFVIYGVNGPIEGVLVELRYETQADAQACWCSGQVHPIISGVTNVEGEVTFHVSGGGCLDTTVHPNAIGVYLNNIPCKIIGQVSPDIISSTVLCAVGLNDAVRFTFPLATASYEFCCDLNSDLQVGLTDGVILAASAGSAAPCP
jgi:hypothetical protein